MFAQPIFRIGACALTSFNFGSLPLSDHWSLFHPGRREARDRHAIDRG
jgi:hypothetical protein